MYHSDKCTCAACQDVNLADLSNAFSKIDKGVFNDYLKNVYNQSITATDIFEPLHREYVAKMRDALEAGLGKKLTEAASTSEFALYEKMQRNINDFAAHKQHSLSRDLRTALFDREGKKRSFDDFEKMARNFGDTYNERYFKTELQLVTQQANAAEAWQGFQEMSDIYPNLRYVAVDDARVRLEHKALDNIVRPINDSFWLTHYPPNGWNCRCKTIAVDEDVTPIDKVPVVELGRNFQNNVGISGEIFSTNSKMGHPYFQVTAADGERIGKQAEKILEDFTKKQTLEIKKFADKDISVQGLNETVRITEQDLQTIVNQPHPFGIERNDLLNILDVALNAALYEDKKAVVEIEAMKFVFNFLNIDATTLTIQSIE